MEKLNFQVLAINGANYLSWAPDVEEHLASKGLEDTVIIDDRPNLQDKAKALILIRHHLTESLKTQYMNEFNSRVLWEGLKACFDHMRDISLLHVMIG